MVAGPHPYLMMVRDFQTAGHWSRGALLDHGIRRPAAGCAGGLCRRRVPTPWVCSIRSRGRVGRAVRRAGGGRGEAHCAGYQRRDVVRRLARSAVRQPYVLCWKATIARSSRRTRSRPASTTLASVPEHAWLKDSKRATYAAITDREALRRSTNWMRIEGIMPALETGQRHRAPRKAVN